MRCFLAFPLPEQIHSELAWICTGMPHTTWVKPENFHITIQFFQNLEEKEVEILQEILSSFPTFQIVSKVRGLGFFKQPKGSATIWMGLENSKEIFSIRTKIIDKIKSYGFLTEKKYEPHVTLGRCKQFISNRWNSYFESFSNFESSSFILESFCLYKSTLSPSGSIYEELFCVR